MIRSGTVINMSNWLFLFDIKSPYFDHLNTEIKCIIGCIERLLEWLLVTFLIRQGFYFINQKSTLRTTYTYFIRRW